MKLQQVRGGQLGRRCFKLVAQDVFAFMHLKHVATCHETTSECGLSDQISNLHRALSASTPIRAVDNRSEQGQWARNRIPGSTGIDVF